MYVVSAGKFITPPARACRKTFVMEARFGVVNVALFERKMPVDAFVAVMDVSKGKLIVERFASEMVVLLIAVSEGKLSAAKFVVVSAVFDKVVAFVAVNVPDIRTVIAALVMLATFAVTNVPSTTKLTFGRLVRPG